MAYIFKNMKNLKQINASAFENASNGVIGTIEADFEGLNQLIDFGTNALYNTKLSSISLKDCVALAFPANNNSCFASNPALTTIDITGCTMTKFQVNMCLSDVNLVNVIGWEAIKPTFVTFGNSCFNGCSALNLDIENMPELVTVGSGAFKNNASLTANLGVNWNKIVTIDNEAFFGCGLLGIADFSNSITLTKLGNDVFGGVNATAVVGPTKLDCTNCTSLTYVGERLCKFNKRTTEAIFDNCTALTNFGGNGLGGIGTGSFTECLGIQKISCRNCTALTWLGPGFVRCDGTINTTLTTVDLTGCIELTHFSNSGFTKCAALAHIGWLDDADDWNFYAPHSKYPKLEYIDTNLTAINFPPLTNICIDGLLGEIPLRASCFSAGANIRKVSIKDCVNATQFGDNSTRSYPTFGSVKTIAIDASGWTNCTVFKHNSISSGTNGLSQLGSTPGIVDLDECFPNLQVIEDRAILTGTGVAFTKLKCTNGNLTSIGEGAFNCLSNSPFKTLELKSNSNLTIGQVAFAFCNDLDLIDIECTGTLTLGDRAFSAIGMGDGSTPGACSLNTLVVNIKSGSAPVVLAPNYSTAAVQSAIQPCVFSGLACDRSAIVHFSSAVEAEMKSMGATDSNYICDGSGAVNQSAFKQNNSVSYGSGSGWNSTDMPSSIQTMSKTPGNNDVTIVFDL